MAHHLGATTRALPALGTLVLGALLLAGPPPRGAGAAEDRREAEAAARTILSALQDRVIAEGQVAPNLLEEVTTTCEEDRVYCKVTDLGDAAKTRISIRLDLTGRFETTDDMPVPKRWEGVPVRRDPASDALVRTRTLDTRQGRRTVVDVRAAHQGVYFYLGSTQLASERSAEDAVASSESRFRKMVEAAKQNGLIGEDLPRVVARSGDETGQTLADGDVVYVTLAEDAPIQAVLEIEARAAAVPAGEEHAIDLAFPSLDAGGRRGLRIAPAAEGTGEGFRIRSRSEDPVRVTIALTRALFDRLRAGEYTTRLGTVLPVTIRGGGGTRRIFLQFTEWAIVITRFELRGLDDPRLSNLRRDMAARLGQAAVSRGPFRQFNEERTLLGNLRDAWSDLLPRVRPGQPENTEVIVAAWARNQETGEDLVLGVHKPDDPTAGARIVGVEHRPDFEVLVLRDPRFVPEADDDADLGLEDFGGDGFREERHLGGIGRDAQEIEAETHEHFFLDALEASAHPVAELAGPSEEEGVLIDRLEPWDGQWRDKLDREHAIQRYVGRDWGVPERPLNAYKTHAPGLYEYRLSLTIARRAAPSDKRSAAVALRVRLVRPDVGVTALEFKTARGR